MKFTRHATTLLAAVGASVLLLAGSGCAAATPSGHPTCTDHRVPVILPAGGAQRVHARLCVPGGPVRAVQVLLPDRDGTAATWSGSAQGSGSGAGRPGRASWVWSANRAGFATLAVDLPAPAGHTAAGHTGYTDQAAAAHQLVGALRSGALGPAYRRVVLVGQGSGGYPAWQEAGTWSDVDALVLLGVAPTARPAGGVDDPGQAGPADVGMTSRVRARVLVVVGDRDAGLCGRRRCSAARSAAGEPLGGVCSRWFPKAGWCGVYVQPDAGRDVLAARTAAPMSVRVSGWVVQAVGPLPAARTGCAYPCPARADG
jgi:hypothetical protein